MTVLAHAFNTSGPGAWVLWIGLGFLVVGALRIAGVGKRQLPEYVGVACVVVGVVVAVVGNMHKEPVAPDPASRPVSTGSVAIVSPEPGTVTRSGELSLQIDVEDFEVTNDLTNAAQPGVGHLHVIVDGVIMAQPTELSGPIDICVDEGTHEVSAVLVAQDHYGFANEAELSDSVTVTSEGRC